jgi:hypothetical protein
MVEDLALLEWQWVEKPLHGLSVLSARFVGHNITTLQAACGEVGVDRGE